MTPNQTTVLKFDGTNDFGSIPDNNAYSYVTNSGLTVSVWLRPDSVSMTETEGTGYVEWLNKTGNAKNEWLFRMYQQGNSENRENRISFYHFTSTGGLGSGASFQDVVKPGEWIHVVGTMGTQYISIYKNGVFRSKDDWVAFPITPSNTASTIRVGAGGDNSDTLGSFLQGSLADLRIYNRVLTDAEILDLSHNVNVSNGLVGWFKGSDGSSSVLVDSSVTANNGTLSGAIPEAIIVETRKTEYDNVPAKYNNITNVQIKRKAVSNFTKSLTLNGTSQNATITDASQTGLDVGLNDFMVGGWFKMQDNAAIQMLMAKYSGASYANNASGVGWELMWRGDQATKGFNFRMNDGSASGVSLSFSANQGVKLGNGEWNHIAVAVDRSDRGYLFLNGIVIGSGAITSITGTLSSTGDFFIGRQSGTGTGNWLKGSVSDCFLYDFGVDGLAITNPSYPVIADVVMDIYAKGVYSTTGLVSRWTLDNTANDFVGSNDLTLTASPSYGTDIPSKARLTATRL